MSRQEGCRNGRSTLDGYPKRPAKGTELHGDSSQARTAKKYTESEMRPVYSLSGVKASKLDPYKEQITVWLEETPYSAERILEKIREQGFEGGHSMVREFVRNKKAGCGMV